MGAAAPTESYSSLHGATVCGDFVTSGSFFKRFNEAILLETCGEQTALLLLSEDGCNEGGVNGGNSGGVVALFD